MKHLHRFNEKIGVMLHGADYNPEQWIRTPEVWDEDMRLMKLAKCNIMSIGIFAWTTLEPAEGRYDFSWMDTIMDKLAENGMYAALATPSGAKPSWMAQRYPEIRRVAANRVRDLQGGRHNHCFTSPVYRQKTAAINGQLAQRYKDHPALALWHVSNEYSGECHCELCQAAFRTWLQNKYQNLDKLNEVYWTNFWSHAYTDWSEIESPAPHGEGSVTGLNLDWRRFITDQTISFFENEIAPLKEITPDVPVTANFMGTYSGLDYRKFARHLDVACWDSYPDWHGRRSIAAIAQDTAFVHDINRSLKSGNPFLLMESTPSITNWKEINILKRPGMHLLSSIQAVAHGSDSVQYFQWRKNRGSLEQYHGAVVDHCGHENTRVFKEVAEVGAYLDKLEAVAGTTVKAETAIIFDWENHWGIQGFHGFSRKRDYEGVCKSHYGYFWQNGIPVDVIGVEDDFSSYKLLIAPMLYMVKPGVAERIEAFVKEGGTFVATYLSGLADENGLCFLGGFPGPLRKVLGIWAEEMDSLQEGQINHVLMPDGSAYAAHTFCELIHCESAEALAAYQSDFYAGRPALTRNVFGDGKAYYIAARTEDAFLHTFYQNLCAQLKIRRNLTLKEDLPEGITIQARTDGEDDFLFIMNFNEMEETIVLEDQAYFDLLDGAPVTGSLTLETYGVRVLRRKAK